MLCWPANLRGGGDNSVDTIFEGVQELDNHEAVKIGDLEKNSEAINVARPMFNKIYWNAAVREGVDE